MVLSRLLLLLLSLFFFASFYTAVCFAFCACDPLPASYLSYLWYCPSPVVFCLLLSCPFLTCLLLFPSSSVPVPVLSVSSCLCTVLVLLPGPAVSCVPLLYGSLCFICLLCVLLCCLVYLFFLFLVFLSVVLVCLFLPFLLYVPGSYLLPCVYLSGVFLVLSFLPLLVRSWLSCCSFSVSYPVL